MVKVEVFDVHYTSVEEDERVDGVGDAISSLNSEGLVFRSSNTKWKFRGEFPVCVFNFVMEYFISLFGTGILTGDSETVRKSNRRIVLGR